LIEPVKLPLQLTGIWQCRTRSLCGVGCRCVGRGQENEQSQARFHVRSCTNAMDVRWAFDCALTPELSRAATRRRLDKWLGLIWTTCRLHLEPIVPLVGGPQRPT